MKCPYCKKDVRLGPDWIDHGLSCEDKILVTAKVTVDGVEVKGSIEEFETLNEYSAWDMLVELKLLELKRIAKKHELKRYTNLKREYLAQKIWDEVDWQDIFPVEEEG